MDTAACALDHIWARCSPSLFARLLLDCAACGCPSGRFGGLALRRRRLSLCGALRRRESSVVAREIFKTRKDRLILAQVLIKGYDKISLVVIFRPASFTLIQVSDLTGKNTYSEKSVSSAMPTNSGFLSAFKNGRPDIMQMN